jgi:hypothetical protein
MSCRLVQSFVGATVQGFVNPNDSAEKKNAYAEFAAVLIAFVLSLIIISLVGKLLWNGVVVDLFTCVRPAKSFWQILGLFVFLSLLA